MQQPNELSGQQSLDLIESMINRAKDHFTENGFLYLLWGWVVFGCSVTQFVLVKIVHYERHYLIWMVTWLAVIFQLIYLAKRKRRIRVKTYTHHIVRFVWISFIVTLFLMLFVLGTSGAADSYRLINPVFLALYGIPTFLSGIILRFKPLVTGGICCWLLCILAPFISYDYQILLLSTAMLAAWIVPGYLLKAKYKKVNV